MRLFETFRGRSEEAKLAWIGADLRRASRGVGVVLRELFGLLAF